MTDCTLHHSASTIHSYSIQNPKSQIVRLSAVRLSAVRLSAHVEAHVEVQNRKSPFGLYEMAVRQTVSDRREWLLFRRFGFFQGVFFFENCNLLCRFVDLLTKACAKKLAISTHLPHLLLESLDNFVALSKDRLPM
jgi:hypothetical protein